MNSLINKVTCFITRNVSQQTELLLFQHPYAGVQIPAGTVEPGETPTDAACREAIEETSLNELELIRQLGKERETLSSGHMLISQATDVYSRPDSGSFAWAHFRTGLLVKVIRHNPGFTQVDYIESDHFPNPQYTTYRITGWVPDVALTDQCVRHFYLFKTPAQTSQEWTVITDNHKIELFWAPLNDLPSIVEPQDDWLKWLVGQI